MERRCDKCDYYQPTGKVVANLDGGECRIAPPRATSGIESGPRWPIVLADEWCGAGVAKVPEVLPFPADRVAPTVRPPAFDCDEEPRVLPFPGVRGARGKLPGGGAK